MTLAVICLAAGAAATLPFTGLLSSPAATTTRKAPTVTGDAHADALLARMTLADKLTLLEWIPDLAAGPGKAATLPGLPGLGIPALHLADGMPGAASARTAPAMTAPLGVAATFSQRDAYANGAVIGRDARALGQQVVGLPLAAMTAGVAGSQDAATFGGDPLLAGHTAAAEVRGIQRQGTMAMAEGYLGVGASDASPAGSAGAAAVGSAALHEIYLPPFEDAIRAGLAAIMCSPASVQASGVPPAAGRRHLGRCLWLRCLRLQRHRCRGRIRRRPRLRQPRHAHADPAGRTRVRRLRLLGLGGQPQHAVPQLRP